MIHGGTEFPQRCSKQDLTVYNQLAISNTRQAGLQHIFWTLLIHYKLTNKNKLCLHLIFFTLMMSLYLFVSWSESPLLSLSPSLPHSFNLSPKETWCGTKKPSNSTEAKPEITAPILDSFPPFLPLATACDAAVKHEQALNPLLHWSNSAMFPWLVHDDAPHPLPARYKIIWCRATRFLNFQDVCFALLLIWFLMQHFNTWEMWP